MKTSAKHFRPAQGFPTFSFAMYPFSISTDKHVPLQHLDRWTWTPKISYAKIFYHDCSQIFIMIIHIFLSWLFIYSPIYVWIFQN